MSSNASHPINKPNQVSMADVLGSRLFGNGEHWHSPSASARRAAGAGRPQQPPITLPRRFPGPSQLGQRDGMSNEINGIMVKTNGLCSHWSASPGKADMPAASSGPVGEDPEREWQ